MDSVLKIIVPLFLLVIAGIVVTGLWTMLKGDNPNKSQALMRLRIILQAIAIFVIMGLLWFSGRGPGSY